MPSGFVAPGGRHFLPAGYRAAPKSHVSAEGGGLTLDDSGRVVGGPNGRPEYLRNAVDGSLRRLGTDHIDLCYQHRVDPNVPVEETFGALGELVAAGKVRYLGICEALPESIRAAHATAHLSAVQSEYSLFTRTAETNGVLETVKELGIGFVAYSPLGRGLLTGGLRTIEDLPENDFRRTAPRFAGENLQHNLQLVDRVRAVADDLHITAGQLALAWVLAQGDHVTAIPGTKRRTYLEQNVAASGVVLGQATLKELDEAVPADAVVGQRYTPPAMASIQE
ncbi:aldo/keto reductase [Streptomyces bobili]|uniref:aldo/keto reductase n=1 Tax=Streptomyces bobili TaxID=67280 RepID=UPI0033B062B3